MTATTRGLVKHLRQFHHGERETPPANEIRPRDSVLMITHNGNGFFGRHAKWGLVGSFLDREPHIPLIELRSEGLDSTPFYGKLLKRNRCLIPATALFEWQALAGGGKQKIRISDQGRKPMMLAGIFDHHPVAGTSCAILTTASNELVAPFSERMPVILDQGAYAFWLGEHDEFPLAEYMEAIRPSPSHSLALEEVPEPEKSPQLEFAFA